MAIPVTRTKIILPRRRSDLLSRSRLLDLLYNLLDFKLIIMAAPAGYGKTSLLVDFAHQVDLPVCWYSLDALDQDPQRFITHFIAALAQRFPGFGAQSLAALEADGQASLDTNRLVTAIVNEAYEHIREHFLLILDDYHLVSDSKEVDAFVNHFVQDVDENCHVVLSSRALLTIPDLPLLVAHSQVGGLSFEELAFRSDEIQNLILQNYQIAVPTTAADELALETEGWITGLLLSAQTMWQGMVDRLRVARVSGVGLYDYLAQQVLDQQAPAVRDFLLRTSLLEEFDAELCQDLWGRDENWSAWIENVLQNNLFVLPVGEDGLWVRYHHLFRDFLQAQLEQERPAEKAAVLRSLGALYASRQDWEKAYTVYQRLGDVERTAELIEQAGPSLLKGGRLVILSEWIDALPDRLLFSHPNLLSLRGGLWVMQGQVERGLSLLAQAEAGSRALDDLPGLARTLARRAVAHRYLGDYPASLEAANQALSLAEADPNLAPIQAEALRVTGASLYQLGRLQEAIEQLAHSLKIYTSLDDRQNIAMLSMELGIADMSAGRYRQALSCYRQSLAYWRDTNNTVGQANLLNNLGVLYHLKGDYERAAAVFEESLNLARQNRYTSMQAYALCSIGDLYVDLGAAEAAQDAFRQAREVVNQLDDRFLLLYLELAEAAQSRLAGNIAQAGRHLEAAGQLAQRGGSFFEQGLWQLEAGCLCLAEDKSSPAVEHLASAALLFGKGGQQIEAARTHLYLAVAYHELHDGQAALKALEQAFHITGSLESRHNLVVAARDARRLLEAVPSDSTLASQASRLLKAVLKFEESIPSLRRRLRPYAVTIPFAPPMLTIRTLGRAQIELDGKPVTAVEWQNQKRVREFFFYLLTNREGLSKEAIGLIFWPDSSPAQLKLQFKNTIYRLRHALGPDIILFDEDRYWFNRGLDYEYDLESFREKLDQAQAADNPSKKKTDLRAALSLYKGPYLPEIEGSWVWPERERLWQTYVEAVLSLARLLFEDGEYGATLDYCQQLLAEDPCLEEAHRLVMQAYAARGNRAALKRQFERCRRALMEEVGARPSQQTEQLYNQLSS